ncbi:MAG TPA: TonB-dependent receptor [Opitutaceae bacterium]|jgi:iron complex outermembrane receptor protein
MTSTFLRRFRALPLVWLGCTLTLLAKAETATRTFDLPAGPAAQTLKQFADQSQCEIVFSAETVAGTTTNAVQGDLAPDAALDRMLFGTSLYASKDKTGTFAVLRKAAKPAVPVAADPPPPAASSDQVLTLSPFQVSSQPIGRYEATEATSGTRYRMPLMDASQSVTVISHDLVQDVGATRILDAAKYAAGISESTIPNAQDRTNIRGFQTDGATIDGFNFFSFSNLDPVVIDSIEIVKGPNAILSPQVQSGTINVISKKPLWNDAGYFDVSVGRYDADRAEFDVNQVVLNNQLAVRVVGAVDHSHDLADGNFNHSQIVMPMATFKFSDRAEVTAQAQVYNSYNAAYGGVPLDFSDGTNSNAQILPGIPTDLDLYGTEIARHSQGQHFRIFFDAEPTDQFSIRLALNTIHWTGDSVGLSIGNPIDPSTGKQVTEIGQMLAQNSQNGAWYPTGVTIANPIFNEQSASTPYAAGTWGFQTRRYYNLQNDYSYKVTVGDFESTTLAGYMVDYLKNPGWSYPFATANMNVTSFSLAPIMVDPVVTADSYSIGWDQQFYASERLSLFGGKLIVTGGMAESQYRQYTSDLYHGTTSQNRVQASLPSGSVVFRPIPELSVFADTTRQAQPNGTSPATGTNPTTTGKQYEFGLRTQLFNQRVYATLTYFDIQQNNFSIPNQANAVVPPPAIPFPPIFTNRQDKGVEFETTSAITDNLSIIGNFSYEHDRTPAPLNQVFRGVADKTADAFLNYAFGRSGPLAGASAGIGVDYASKRPGDNPNPGGFVTGATQADLAVGQPTFYLPARTLVNVMFSYRFDKHWRGQLNINNVLDAKYLAASTSRNNVFPGTPINPYFTMTYQY